MFLEIKMKKLYFKTAKNFFFSKTNAESSVLMHTGHIEERRGVAP
jgi:hypothetical protein